MSFLIYIRQPIIRNSIKLSTNSSSKPDFIGNILSGSVLGWCCSMCYLLCTDEIDSPYCFKYNWLSYIY